MSVREEYKVLVIEYYRIFHSVAFITIQEVGEQDADKISNRISVPPNSSTSLETMRRRAASKGYSLKKWVWGSTGKVSRVFVNLFFRPDAKKFAQGLCLKKITAPRETTLQPVLLAC